MKKLTTDEFIAKAKMVHGDTYDYSHVKYVNMHVPIKIECKIHGFFYQEPSNHLKGAGCSICNKILKRILPFELFLKRSYDIHGDKYDYSQVVYVNTKTKVKIICPKHGVFEQIPEKHMSGQGCPMCRLNVKDTKETFIKKARQVHGDLYDYSQVDYINSQTKICIIDKEYGSFMQMPYAHLNGEGHPLRKPEKCYETKKKNGTLNSSRPEIIVKYLLIHKFGKNDVLTQYRSKVYPYACDFYIKSYDLYIELNLYITHGGHWFNSYDEQDIARLKTLQSRTDKRNLYEKMIQIWTVDDLEKRNIAIKNHLNYVVFWKYDLSDFMQWYNSFDRIQNLHII